MLSTGSQGKHLNQQNHIECRSAQSVPLGLKILVGASAWILPVP